MTILSETDSNKEDVIKGLSNGSLTYHLVLTGLR